MKPDDRKLLEQQFSRAFSRLMRWICFIPVGLLTGGVSALCVLLLWLVLAQLLKLEEQPFLLASLMLIAFTSVATACGAYIALFFLC